MKRVILTSVAALMLAGTVNAGSVAYVAPAEPAMVEDAAPMGSSGAWIIPLIAIALIALAISQDDDEPPIRGIPIDIGDLEVR